MHYPYNRLADIRQAFTTDDDPRPYPTSLEAAITQKWRDYQALCVYYGEDIIPIEDTDKWVPFRIRFLQTYLRGSAA